MHEKQLAQVNARTIHATGLDPSDLGSMQPEGPSQQSELKMQADIGCRDGPTRPGDDAAEGLLPAK